MESAGEIRPERPLLAGHGLHQEAGGHQRPPGPRLLDVERLGDGQQIRLLHVEVSIGPQIVLQAPQSLDERGDLRRWKEAGEELQQVAQLLALDSQRVQQIVLASLQDARAVAHDAAVLPRDALAGRADDGREGLCRVVVAGRLAQERRPFLHQPGVIGRLQPGDDLGQRPGAMGAQIVEQGRDVLLHGGRQYRAVAGFGRQIDVEVAQVVGHAAERPQFAPEIVDPLPREIPHASGATRARPSQGDAIVVEKLDVDVGLDARLVGPHGLQQPEQDQPRGLGRRRFRRELDVEL